MQQSLKGCCRGGDWRDRPPWAQPDVSISVPPIGETSKSERVVTLDDPVAVFLYRGGVNPFPNKRNVDANYAQHGIGAIEWNWFDPEHRRPYDDDNIQTEKGYYGYMSWDEETEQSEGSDKSEDGKWSGDE